MSLHLPQFSLSIFIKMRKITPRSFPAWKYEMDHMDQLEYDATSSIEIFVLITNRFNQGSYHQFS